MRRRLLLAAVIYIVVFWLPVGMSYAAEQPETLSETYAREDETESTAGIYETAETGSESETVAGVNKDIPSEQRKRAQEDPAGEDAETESGTEPETAFAQDTDNGSEETEAFEEGDPDFLFQAGGFKVLNEDAGYESGISLYAAGDMDVLADKMYTALKGRAQSIAVKDYGFYWDNTEDRKQLLTLYYAVINDHPDLYFARTGYGVSYNTKTKLISKITPNYFVNVDDNAFQAGVQKAKSAVTSDMDDLQKAIAIHDYLVLNCEYDKERLNNKTIPQESYGAYGALANRIAVCQGYALAYKYLMNEYGIECYIVTSDNMNHAWNIVQIDGELYQVDTTWDDPTWDRFGLVSHSNMFLSDTAFGKNHRDWYVTKGSGMIDLKAEGAKYDSAFWRDVKSPLVYDAGGTKKYYYVSADKKIQSRACSAQKIDADCTTLITLDTSSSGLAFDGTKLYYNTSKSIAYIDITDSTYAEHVQFSLKDEDSNNIYGFIKSNDTIRYVKRAGESPSGKSTIYVLNDSEDGASESESGVYTVTFRDDFGTVFDVQKINEGGYAVPPDKKMTPQPGYQFSAWKGNYSNIQKDETVTAIYKKYTYTIKYELNGGKNNSANPAKYDVETPDITLSDPLKREYYDFLGWYEEPEFATKVTAIKKGSIGNRTLYAKWELEKYTISYELDGGKNNTQNKTEYDMETETFTFADPTKKGYLFEGWYAEPECTTKVTAIEKGSIGNRTLYAKWELEKYTISYELDGGKNNTQNKTEYDMETGTFTFASPTKRGYEFEGWYAEPECTTKVTAIEKGSIGDRTIYAKWKILEYDLEYEVNGGKNSPQNPLQYNVETDTIHLEAPSHEDAHYAFEGWFTDSSFTRPISSIKKGSVGNLRLYAKWAKYYRVRFFDSTGKLIAETKTAEGKDATPPETPIMDGYVFTEWDKAYKNVREDIDITAVYEPVQYTIIYVLGGGSNSAKNPKTYTIETEDFKLASPKHKNTELAFAGWYRDKGCKERVTSIKKGSTGDITLYAKWKKVQQEDTSGGSHTDEPSAASRPAPPESKASEAASSPEIPNPQVESESETLTRADIDSAPAVTVITSLDPQKSNTAPSASEMGSAEMTGTEESPDSGADMETVSEPEMGEKEGQQESAAMPDGDFDETNTELSDNKQKNGMRLWMFLAVSLVMTAVAGGVFGVYAWKKKKDRTQ